MSFAATVGVNYKIAVDGFDGETGAIDLSISAPPPPANDDLADATVLSGTTATGSNIGASAEPGEPVHEGVPGGTSVWWRWTPTVSGEATVSTCGSGFAALTGVYTGASVGALTDVVTAAAFCPVPNAAIVGFAATAGQTYHIAVDGFEGHADPRRPRAHDLHPRGVRRQRVAGAQRPVARAQDRAYSRRCHAHDRPAADGRQSQAAEPAYERAVAGPRIGVSGRRHDETPFALVHRPTLIRAAGV